MIYYLSLGSNQGDKNSNINKAIDFLRGIGDIEEVSSLYETEPVGMETGAGNFYNLVLCMQIPSKLSPLDLLWEIKLKELRPLEIISISKALHLHSHPGSSSSPSYSYSYSYQPLFDFLLFKYHYLSYKGSVGENLKYLVFDRFNRPLCCLLFGSSAWKVSCRDEFIGWDASTRQRNVNYISNNMRFLILPWVRVYNLAIHILAQICRRIRLDWGKKYGHEIYLLETFVERDRFLGTSYKTANWICVGQTAGRSRNDRYMSLKVPVKDVYVYPLMKDFRHHLNFESGKR